jgi:CrcB protein
VEGAAEKGGLMPPASAFAAVASGAVLGAWTRWYLIGRLNAAWPHLPLGTLVANVAGGFVIGFLVAFLLDSPQIHPNFRLFAITGFLGALTTFSSFSAESLELLQAGRYGWALAHTAAHLFGSLAAAATGFAAWRLVHAG